MDPERVLRRHLKSSYFDMPTKKLKLRQRSSITWIRLGNVNSKLFHERVNRHRKKNFMQAIQTDSGIAITKEDKEEVLRKHFHDHLGKDTQRNRVLDWNNIGITRHDLADLDSFFDEQEIKDEVFSLP